MSRIPEIDVTIEGADNQDGIPGQIWIGRIGVSKSIYVFLTDESAYNWMSSRPAGSCRLWNAALTDPVEYWLIPPVPAKLTDVNPNER